MEENQTLPLADADSQDKETYTVPWSISDTWIGLFLLFVLYAGMVVVLLTGVGRQYLQDAGIVILEISILLPIAIIFAWRRINWKQLGFGKFNVKVLGIGCGLMLVGYLFLLLHNLILYWLNIDTQSEEIFNAFSQLDTPIWLLIAGAIVAPLVEEMFFRGFLFQGFRQKYGVLSAILLSSFFFALAHLDPVAFIPTFIFGSALAYIYHLSKSLWPGIIFHACINSFSLCAVYVITKYPGLIPS